MVKVLNLYAGIGGNRQLWDADVTAVEMDETIAGAYQSLYPADTVLVGTDAHQYLLEHHQEYDFIWSSPPCQSHSRMIRSGRNRAPRYPDCRLYEEVLMLTHDHTGPWVVENVKPYYRPLIEPRYMGRHAFWSNFDWTEVKEPEKDFDFINGGNNAGVLAMQEWLGIRLDKNIYYNGNHCPKQVYRNAVHPLVGAHIYEAALNQE